MWEFGDPGAPTKVRSVSLEPEQELASFAGGKPNLGGGGPVCGDLMTLNQNRHWGGLQPRVEARGSGLVKGGSSSLSGWRAHPPKEGRTERRSNAHLWS